MVTSPPLISTAISQGAGRTQPPTRTSSGLRPDLFTVMPVHYFDSARDSDLIKAGTHFWCGICLVARHNSEASPRTGRCLACYETLHQETITPMIPIKATWDIITPALSHGNAQAQGAAGKRGPRHHTLPVPLIKQLAAEKKSSREIAEEVQLQTKTKVSYRTVQRILSGQRKEHCHAR